MLEGTRKASEVIFELFRAMKSVDAQQADKLYSVFEQIETLEDGAKAHSETVEKMSNRIEDLEERLDQDEEEHDGVAIEIVADAEVEASFQANESDEWRSEISVYKNQAQELEQQLDQVRNVLGFNVNRQLAHNNQLMQNQILEWYRMSSEITEAMSSGDVVDDMSAQLVSSILENVTLNEPSEDAEHIEQEAEPPINE
jgi:septal ring factor EnvC (AmiA/AmiB activator)